MTKMTQELGVFIDKNKADFNSGVVTFLNYIDEHKGEMEEFAKDVGAAAKAINSWRRNSAAGRSSLRA